jgi:hypothetical protein
MKFYRKSVIFRVFSLRNLRIFFLRRVEKKPQKENKVSEFSLGASNDNAHNLKNLDDVTTKNGNEEEFEGNKVIEASETT